MKFVVLAFAMIGLALAAPQEVDEKVVLQMEQSDGVSITRSDLVSRLDPGDHSLRGALPRQPRADCRSGPTVPLVQGVPVAELCAVRPRQEPRCRGQRVRMPSRAEGVRRQPRPILHAGAPEGKPGRSGEVRRLPDATRRGGERTRSMKRRRALCSAKIKNDPRSSALSKPDPTGRW